MFRRQACPPFSVADVLDVLSVPVCVFYTRDDALVGLILAYGMLSASEQNKLIEQRTG